MRKLWAEAEPAQALLAEPPPQALQADEPLVPEELVEAVQAPYTRGVPSVA